MINALSLGSKGYLAADSAWYDTDGVVRAFAPKITVLPRLRAAFATRGAQQVASFLADHFDAFDSFDDLIAEGGEVLERGFDDGCFRLNDQNGAVASEDAEVVVVGWSSRHRRVRCLALSSVAHPELAPFTFHERDVLYAPAPTPVALDTAGLTRGGVMLRPSDPKGFFRVLAGIQRGMTVPTFPGSDREAHVVGGEVTMVSVSEHGCEQTVILRWPDQVGKPIQLQRWEAPASVGNVEPMNRQQRRAAKRAQRIAAA